MIPNIFISSTIADLLHLRDALRDTVAELGYNPVLSEHGGVGFLPSATAEESCYLTIKQCHAAVVIIGKRYGTLGKGGASITHNEFRIAREEALPMFCLVDRELLAFKAVFDAQPAGGVTFPGMENAEMTFAFLREVMDSRMNNAVLPFGNVAEARQQLKTQFAHLLAEMLRQKFDPVMSDVRDVLSEIKTLRYELKSSKQSGVDLGFLRAVRMLLDDRFSDYRDLLKRLYPAMEHGIEKVLSSPTFDDFVQMATKYPPDILEFPVPFRFEDYPNDRIRSHTTAMAKWPLPLDDDTRIEYAVGDRVLLNQAALKFFRALHNELKRAVTGQDSEGR